MDGIAQAFEDKDVQNAILSGLHGSIVVALVEWSDTPRMTHRLDADRERGWRPWRSPSGCAAFRAMRENSPAWRGALRYIEDRVLPLQPLVAERRIIDVSGDGEENCNPEEPIDAIRDQLVAEGVTINGLPIAGVGPPGELEGWYREHVIGGPFSFVLTAAGFEDFPRAIRRKFLVEISCALADAVALIAPPHAAPGALQHAEPVVEAELLQRRVVVAGGAESLDELRQPGDVSPSPSGSRRRRNRSRSATPSTPRCSIR